jgi:hypothetical protein
MRRYVLCKYKNTDNIGSLKIARKYMISVQNINQDSEDMQQKTEYCFWTKWYIALRAKLWKMEDFQRGTF